MSRRGRKVLAIHCRRDSVQQGRVHLPYFEDLRMVGAVRFELTTSCTRNKRATRLRYAPPTKGAKKCTHAPEKANTILKFFASDLHQKEAH